jgi:hypothetical protein
MYDDVLGKRREVKINEKSDGDTAPCSFGQIWEDNQRLIDGKDKDDFEDEYEDLQMSSF